MPRRLSGIRHALNVRDLVSRSQALWPPADEYSVGEAHRIATLFIEKNGFRNEVSNESYRDFIRANIRRTHKQSTLDDGTNSEYMTDIVAAKTDFNHGTGGGWRVIRSGKEMT